MMSENEWRAAVVQFRSLRKKVLFASNPMKYEVYYTNIKYFSYNLERNLLRVHYKDQLPVQ
jgi:hypothetical protein